MLLKIFLESVHNFPRSYTDTQDANVSIGSLYGDLTMGHADRWAMAKY